jgi:transcriptional regulator with XRE-family HTH domain
VPTRTPPRESKPVSAAPTRAAKALDPKKALGLRIKALRVEHQLTQEDLSDACGMFRTYMSRIESGQANPTLTMLHDIARAFKIDIRELFAPADHGAHGVPVKALRVIASKPKLSRGRVSR